MKNIQEILTFDIKTINNDYFLDIPVQKLINPKFMIVDSDLYIFLHNYTQCFIIKSLPDNIINNIPKNNCYIKQKLNLDDSPILIKLF